MTNRERALAVLRYQPYDRMPIVHFGYWRETLQKWAAEGHISAALVKAHGDGNPADYELNAMLGWDFNWQCMFSPYYGLKPGFEKKVIKTFEDGTQHVMDRNGVVLCQKPGAGSIPAEISHTLTDRKSWDEQYKFRYNWDEKRVTGRYVLVNDKIVPFTEGGLAFLQKGERDYLYGLQAGSLFGNIRNIVGVEGSSYIYCDDEVLYDEMIETNAELCYQNVKCALESGAQFDFLHFWEDICFKNGPLVIPSVFDEKVGPHYKRITELAGAHGIDIVSLDCDGMIDSLIPTWLSNGVNTMFPIEVGTWDASIAPWRTQYGKELRGVGGMNKNVFARDRAAVDAELKRLRELVDLGGYIPCPDHRLPPGAEWDLVKYYCAKMRNG
jgi:uroporphyrinogen decarboxylase